MREIPSNSIDLIITSPPYNRGKNYSSDAQQSYNDNQPESEYLAFLTRVWTECLRVGNEKCVFYLNIGDSAIDQGISEKVVHSAEMAGWIRIQDIVWVKSIYGKGHYTPTGSNKRFNNIWEHIFLLVKNPKKYEIAPKAIGIPYADKSNIGRYGDSDLRDPGNVWHIWYDMTTGASIKKGHDAPFPIGLPYQCMKTIPNLHTVLDPFLGTGTTLAAALKLRIQGYGYEQYPRQELIEQTIRNGINYSPDSPILLPHFEECLELISNLYSKYNKLDFSAILPKSKKECIQWEILIDTLQKLSLSSNPDSKFISQLKNGIMQFKTKEKEDKKIIKGN